MKITVTKKKIVLTALMMVILILEILPFGAVLIFVDMENTYRNTFSYFNPITFGYANFGPFLTALITVIIIVLLVVYLIRNRSLAAIKVFLIIGTLTSLMPLLQGIRYLTVTGVAITVLFIAANIIAWVLKARDIQ